MKIHMRDIRLANNAGMAVPCCLAAREILPTSISCEITTIKTSVTCLNCKLSWNKIYGSWAGYFKIERNK